MLDPGRRRLIAQFARFGVVGVANTAMCYAVLFLLHDRLELPVWLASAVGYGVATVQSFLLNRAWTFAGTRRAQVARQATTFIAVNVICGLVFVGLNSLLITIVPLAAATVLAMTVIVVLSFTLNRLLVF